MLSAPDAFIPGAQGQRRGRGGAGLEKSDALQVSLGPSLMVRRRHEQRQGPDAIRRSGSPCLLLSASVPDGAQAVSPKSFGVSGVG